MSPKSIPIPFDRMSAPAQRVLQGAGYSTLQQLSRVSEREIAKLHGIGPNAWAKLKQELAAHGLSFAQGK
jgi:hypothetical protein